MGGNGSLWSRAHAEPGWCLERDARGDPHQPCDPVAVAKIKAIRIAAAYRGHVWRRGYDAPTLILHPHSGWSGLGCSEGIDRAFVSARAQDFPHGIFPRNLPTASSHGLSLRHLPTGPAKTLVRVTHAGVCPPQMLP